jgi:signal transduction histidine kinase
MTAALVRHDPAVRNVEIEVTGSAPPIAADAELIKIVFQNLLVNAAHALQGRGRIGVAISSADGTCSIAFTDGGSGIRSELRDRIFTPFFTTKARGSGLGLATAKRLVEAHHGQIDVRFPPAGGSTFTVRLPLANGVERAAGPTLPPGFADS